jgi:hypothetical protein
MLSNGEGADDQNRQRVNDLAVVDEVSAEDRSRSLRSDGQPYWTRNMVGPYPFI